MEYHKRKATEVTFRRWIKGEAPAKKLGFSQEKRALYRRFIERFFVDNVSWETYGKTWSIDHIVPLWAFSNDEIELAWSMENLHPLGLRANRYKGGSLVEAEDEINRRLRAYPENVNLQKLKHKLKACSKEKNLPDFNGFLD